MKQLYTLIITFLICSISTYAQPGYINTIAGTGVYSYTGDGGLAANATMGDQVNDMVYDSHGNLIIVDNEFSVIRKISTTGIITTLAGNGTVGFSGDGGLATNAMLYNATGIAIDASDNIYIADLGNHRIRKITASTGIITTVAGNGIQGFSGDGGLAINAQFNMPWDILIDGIGNLYITDNGNNRIRKVDAITGIITTIAGTGFVGFSGDGGLAINAQIGAPQSLIMDLVGNLLFCDANNQRIRKISPTTGIITTIVGNGIAGNLGDGGLATNAMLNEPMGINLDVYGNLYIADNGNGAIRKVNASNNIITKIAGDWIYGYSGDGGLAINAQTYPFGVITDLSGSVYITGSFRIRKVEELGVANASSASFLMYINPLCSGPEIHLLPTTYSSTYSIKTWFGDGLSRIDTISAYLGFTNFNHIYSYPGTYSIKSVLYNGVTAIDSIKYYYKYAFCRTLPIRLYNDANSNCMFDTSSESLIYSPTIIEVDSNGVAIDTIVVLSGVDYNANGNLGDIYKFKVLNATSGLIATCPASGIITDTLVIGNNNPKYIGFHCSGATGFDLAEQVNIQSGRHLQSGYIIVNNNYCSPQNGTVTLNFSPQYIFANASPAPNIISGNAITWNLNGLSSVNAAPVNINYLLSVPTPSNQSTWLPPGDTIHSSIIINPITGDANPANNTCIRIDTVKSSYDPNEMAVSPMPYIQSAGQLQYTIEFENTGNDTAQNISVLDTLSNNLDIHSLAMVASSHSCIYSKTWNGTNWVAKFDFPNIKLLDSSHHNLCNGMLVFNIKTKAGLSAGTTIFNHADIYFDDNPPVITDTVENIIAIPVTPTVAITANNYCPGIATTFTATSTNGGTAPTYQWKKNNVNIGTNSNTFTYTPAYGDSVKCFLTSNALLPIPATVASNTIHIPSILDSFIVVNPVTCGGTSGSITLNGVLPNTVYPISYTKNGVPIGPVNYTSNAFGSLVISGLTAAAYSNIAVTITGGCTTVPINNVYLTNPTPPAAPRVANSTLSICIGDTIHLSASSSLSGAIYSWSGPSFTSAIHNPTIPNAQLSNSGIYSVFVTDPVTNCSSLTATTTVTVNSVVTPTLSISANDTLCTGATLLATASANIASCSYQWHLNTSNVGTNSNTYSYSPANGDQITCSIIATAPSSCYTATIANSNTLTADVLANVTPTISIAGLDTVISGTPTLYTATANIVGGIYQWKVNGNNVGTNTNTYTYTPLAGDVVTCTITVPSAGCFTASNASSNSLHIVIINLGVAPISNNAPIHIYPNPTNSILHIDNLKTSTTYHILNIIGQSVQAGSLQAGANTISTQALASGVYMLQLSDAQGLRSVTRLVKE